MRKLLAVLMALGLVLTTNTTLALAASAPPATAAICESPLQLWVYCGENATAYAVITTGRGPIRVFAMGTDANNTWVQSPGQTTYCPDVLCTGFYSVPGRPGVKWRTIVADGGIPTSILWTWCSSRF